MSKTVLPYDKLDHIREALPRLTRRQRTAFAAGAAERTLPILDHYFSRRGELFRRALDLAWRFAEGENVDETQIEATVNELEKLVDKLYDKDDGASATLYALNALSFGLQSTLKPESKIVEDAVADAAAAARSDDVKNENEHLEEEVDWQLQALQLAQNASAPTRDMFKVLPSDPRWLQQYRAKIGAQ